MVLFLKKGGLLKTWPCLENIRCSIVSTQSCFRGRRTGARHTGRETKWASEKEASQSSPGFCSGHAAAFQSASEKRVQEAEKMKKIWMQRTMPSSMDESNEHVQVTIHPKIKFK